jgi:hypothetical protein
MEYIINPLSLRPIQVDGRLYKDLVNRGIINEFAPKLTKETQQTRLDIVTQTQDIVTQTQLTRSTGNPESESGNPESESLDDELLELDKILDEFASDESDA